MTRMICGFPPRPPPPYGGEPPPLARFRFSPVQVATHTDHRFPSRLQTNVTFEGRARPAPLAIWPFGAPMLLLRCCHGPFGVAPTHPEVPANTNTSPNKQETASRSRSLGRLQGFLITIGLSACQSHRMPHKGLGQRRGRKRFARPCPCTVTIGSRSRPSPGQGSFICLGSCQSYPKARSNWFGTALAFLYFLFHRRSGFLLGFGTSDSKAIDWLDWTENGG